MAKILLNLTLVPLFFVGITFLPWPDLPTTWTTMFGQMFGYLFWFDTVMPVSEAMQVRIYIMTFELAIFGYKIINALIRMINSGQFLNDKSK